VFSKKSYETHIILDNRHFYLGGHAQGGGWCCRLAAGMKLGIERVQVCTR